MAGQSGRNLSISKSKLGKPRFPFERSDVDNSYAGAGPVITYTLSAEEIAAKYGAPPAKKKPRTGWPKKVFRDELVDALRHTQKWTLAMEALGIGRMQMLHMVHLYNIRENEWKKEVNAVAEMYSAGSDNTVNSETAVLSNETFDLSNETAVSFENNTDNPAPSLERKKTNLEIAREKLPKEELIQLKEQGFSDNKILGKFNIHPDTFYKLKKEYGLMGVTINAKPEEAPAGTYITLAQALEMQKELQDDIRCLELIAPVPPLSAGVPKLLTEHGVKCRQRLDDLQKAFENTKIRI